MNTSVHITGTGFDPVTDVIIIMANAVVADITTNNNGEFSGDFDVPLAPPGTFTVTAFEAESSEVGLSATASFTVTSSNPSTSTATQGMLPF